MSLPLARSRNAFRHWPGQTTTPHENRGDLGGCAGPSARAFQSVTQYREALAGYDGGSGRCRHSNRKSDASARSATPPPTVSASPGTQPNSTPSGTRPRHWTSEVQVLVGPPQKKTGRCTSSGRAATASQWLGLHLTRPNTAPRMSLVRVSGVPTATSNDPEGGSQRR